MKQKILLLASFLSYILLTACGAEEEPGTWKGIEPGADLEAVTERTEYWDIAVESEELFEFGLWENNPQDTYTFNALVEGSTVYTPVGTQFYEGEPVQLWTEETLQKTELYLYKKDGSRRLLLSDFPSLYTSVHSHFQCYIDRDGNCYFYSTDYPQTDGEYRPVGTLARLLPSGIVQYENTLEPGFIIDDICQMEDGRIYLLLQDNERAGQLLEELDPDTGLLIKESGMELSFGTVSLGTAEGTPAVAGYGIENGGCGVAAVNAEAQSTTPLLFFYGTSYGWHGDSWLRDFRALQDGSMEFLWTDRNGLNCFRERLRMEKVEKTPVVVRGGILF